ncbi:hypothetical protein C8R45DRAFT_1115633 [Mycena sanguinolenta]|nr:hypothetical protein C8R45DRAFT_1115633 [Mycena sanguinolenta]
MRKQCFTPQHDANDTATLWHARAPTALLHGLTVHPPASPPPQSGAQVAEGACDHDGSQLLQAKTTPETTLDRTITLSGAQVAEGACDHGGSLLLHAKITPGPETTLDRVHMGSEDMGHVVAELLHAKNTLAPQTTLDRVRMESEAILHTAACRRRSGTCALRRPLHRRPSIHPFASPKERRTSRVGHAWDLTQVVAEGACDHGGSPLLHAKNTLALRPPSTACAWIRRQCFTPQHVANDTISYRGTNALRRADAIRPAVHGAFVRILRICAKGGRCARTARESTV